MAAETIGFAVQPEDKPELDRLVARYGNGNRSAFLREALRVMAIRERAERLQEIQAKGKAEVRAKHGRDLTPDELNAITRRVVKGS